MLSKIYCTKIFKEIKNEEITKGSIVFCDIRKLRYKTIIIDGHGGAHI